MLCVILIGLPTGLPLSAGLIFPGADLIRISTEGRLEAGSQYDKGQTAEPTVYSGTGQCSAQKRKA